MHFNKLVRDKIPQIIAGRGQESVTRILPESDYQQALRHKLQEEVAEFGESGEIEELADVLEVVYALAKTKGASPAEVEAIRLKKYTERGGFDQRIFLIEVK